MKTEATNLIQGIEEMPAFTAALQSWLLNDLNDSQPFPQSRAKALFRVTNVVYDPTLNDFSRLLENDNGQRVALFDLLVSSQLADSVNSEQLAVNSGQNDGSWLVLVLAAFAYQREYSLVHLDPAAPPSTQSPAGQVVARAGNFIRKQVQRNTTERDRLARKLAYAGIPMHIPTQQPTADPDHIPQPTIPAPDVYRPPIPINYLETNERVVITEEEITEPAPPSTRSRLVITDSDLPDSQSPIPNPQPLPSPLPPSAVVMPNSQTTRRPSLAMQMRNRVTRSGMLSTKLRIKIQEHPDGGPFYGVQVRVNCQRIRANVAGTTNRQGVFLCEVPVRESEGLTYDVDVTWPRDAGGEVERKSITLNADRTEFRLPFYRRVNVDS